MRDRRARHVIDARGRCPILDDGMQQRVRRRAEAPLESAFKTVPFRRAAVPGALLSFLL